MIIAIGGLIGSGKSTLARKLSGIIENCEVLSSDITRKKLFGLDPFDSAKTDFGKGIYSSDITEKVYNMLVEEAIERHQIGYNVIIDATFSKKKHRKKLIDACKKNNIKFKGFFLIIDDETAKYRLEKRKSEKSISDADWEVYLKMKKNMEPPCEKNDFEIIDAKEDLGKLVKLIIKKIHGGENENTGSNLKSTKERT